MPLLCAVVLFLYAPAWHGGMLWDDDAHLTRVPLRSFDGLVRIWTDPESTQQYYPVVHSAFWMMSHLWGQTTTGYHVVNIVLHGVSAFLIVVLLRRWSVPGAWLAGLLFAVHPVHVESVAWMTELKNTLSGVLYLSAMLVYLRFDSSRKVAAYALALALFVLALLSKSVTATLPAALLVVFWWQRGRIDWRRDVLPLVPFFVLALASGLLTVWVERTLVGAQGTEFQFSPVERVLIAGRAIWFYLGKLLWPVNLSFIYPRWAISQGAWWQYLFPIAALALIGVAWSRRGRSRAPLAVLLLFVGTLFPALGFFNAYPFRYSFVADHFQYLASVPVLAAIAAAVTMVADRVSRANAGAIALGLIVAAPLGVVTWNQAHQYVNAESLYRATIETNPEAWLAYTNLGVLKLDGYPRDISGAIADLQQALRLNSNNAEAHNSLGHAWQELGRFDDALTENREALRLDPHLAEAAYNIAYDLQQLGQFAESATFYEQAIALNPYDPRPRNNLSNVLLALGRPTDALAQLQTAREMSPGSALVRENLAALLLRLGRVDEGVAEYQAALANNPGDAAADIHNELGVVLVRAGRRDEGITHFQEALRLRPGFSEAKENLAAALKR